jgi:hypothetical protein
LRRKHSEIFHGQVDFFAEITLGIGRPSQHEYSLQAQRHPGASRRQAEMAVNGRGTY